MFNIQDGVYCENGIPIESIKDNEWDWNLLPEILREYGQNMSSINLISDKMMGTSILATACASIGRNAFVTPNSKNPTWKETLKLERIQKREQQEREEYELLMKKQAEARKTIEWYDSYSLELQTFHNPDYQREALAIAPMWVFKQATPNAIKHFKYLSTFDPKNKTIVAKIFDYNHQLISYKRRRYLIPGTEEPSKWVTKAQTSPNKQCYIRVDQTSHSPVYIIEGHHDLLTASLLHADEYSSFNFIMVPTENYREFNDYEKGFLIDREVNFIMDVKKEDVKKSAIPMMALASSLPKQEYDNAVLINLFDFLHENKINTDINDKLDLSDAIEKWDDTLTAFKGSLEYHADCIRSNGEIF